MKKFILLCLSSLFFAVNGLAYGVDAFVIIVKTDNTGSSSNTEFTIPTLNDSADYVYNVDCDNNGENEVQNHSGDYTCSYNLAGSYRVVITGKFPAIYFNNELDKEKITAVEQWGTGEWSTMFKAFYGASNLIVTADDAPDLSKATNMYRMFMGASDLTFTYPINNWDVSKIDYMAYMFSSATIFNEDIGDWNVSKVTSMEHMFSSATAFDQNISDWNIASVADMRYMFVHATAFNQDIGGWDTNGVLNMWGTFLYASTFNQDIGDWDVSTVTSMGEMFSNASSFNQDIGDWDVSSVADVRYMFDATTFNQDISDWDMISVTDSTNLGFMFSDSHLSISNYDNLLKSWSTVYIVDNVDFDAGSSNYCQGEDGKNILINIEDWTFNDAGKDCGFYITTPNEVTAVDGELYVMQVETNFVNDPEYPSLSYTLVGGADANKFTLTQGGQLSFENLPDANNPGDRNTDNIYRVQIKAHEDEAGVDDYQTIKVKVVPKSNGALVPTIMYLLN